MDKDTQENPKKEERQARRLARKLLISYVVQNPGAIRIIKKNKNIFDPASDLSVSDFADFILAEDKFAKRTASFIRKEKVILVIIYLRIMRGCIDVVFTL